MTATEFQEQLRRTGEYDTPAVGTRSFADRLLGGWDGWYYGDVLRIVFIARRLAQAGRYDASAWAASAFATLRSCERCGGTVHIRGAQEPGRSGSPAVIIANHMSMAETFVLPAILLTHRDVCFIVKHSLTTHPLFGPIMRAVHPISVTRANPRQDLKDVLEQGQAALAAGRHVVVFPQATRTAFFSPPDFNTLGVKLAARAGVPVIPLALKTDFQGNGKRIKEFGPLDRRQPMHYHFGEPMTVVGREKAAHAEVVAFIRERVTAWGGHVNETTASTKDSSI